MSFEQMNYDLTLRPWAFTGMGIHRLVGFFSFKYYAFCSFCFNIKHKLKSLIIKRQKSLVVYGKDSQHYKELRNNVQRACMECKQMFYDSKVASLKENNISRWWREVKGLTGQRAQTDWVTQLLDEDTPTPAALAEKFNSFLSALTSHFIPLDTTLADLDHNLDVPREFLVDVSSCYKALRQVKNNKSPGPSAVSNKIWKEFASELAPVVTDIYNASLGQGFIPYQIKESLVTPLPKFSPPKCIKDDLRTVTLTFQLAKIFEGFILAPLFNQVIDKIDLKQFADQPRMHSFTCYTVS